MLATAGGVVISGGTIDRKVHAFDAATGKLLWEFPVDSGFWRLVVVLIDGSNTSHRGWLGRDSRGIRDPQPSVPGEFPEVPEGGSVWVFALSNRRNIRGSWSHLYLFQ